MSDGIFPISDDPKIAKLTTMLQAHISRQNEVFTLADQVLSSEEVVSHLGCLSFFLMKAEESYYSIFGYGMGLEFIEEEEGSILGVSAKLSEIDQKTVSFSVLAHFTHYSLDEYMRQYKKNRMLRINDMIPLDPLYGEWNMALQKPGFLRVLPPETTPLLGQRK